MYDAENLDPFASTTPDPFESKPQRAPPATVDLDPFAEPAKPRTSLAAKQPTPAVGGSIAPTDAETILGGVFAEPDVIASLGFLTPADFNDKEHGRTWVALLATYREAATITAEAVVTIDPNLDVSALRALQHAAPQNTAAILAAARRLANRRRGLAASAIFEQAALRIRRASESAANGTRQEEDAPWQSLVADAASEAMELAAPDRFQSADHLETVLRASARNANPPMPTGLKAMDEFLDGGLRAGHVIALGGGPKVGRSVFIASISHNMEVASIPHVVITTEGRDTYTERLKISRRIGINTLHIKPAAAASCRTPRVSDFKRRFYLTPASGLNVEQCAQRFGPQF